MFLTVKGMKKLFKACSEPSQAYDLIVHVQNIYMDTPEVHIPIIGRLVAASVIEEPEYLDFKYVTLIRGLDFIAEFTHA
jgi:hypothetical protein